MQRTTCFGFGDSFFGDSRDKISQLEYKTCQVLYIVSNPSVPLKAISQAQDFGATEFS